eukprot:5136353-Karenia_brevis.AAC.1
MFQGPMSSSITAGRIVAPSKCVAKSVVPPTMCTFIKVAKVVSSCVAACSTEEQFCSISSQGIAKLNKLPRTCVRALAPADSSNMR